MSQLKDFDPAIFKMLQDETLRQTEKLELIASENIVSPSVMEIVGSVLTNKYAEGYPGKRYYGGCECVDVAEDLARDRAKELFGAAYANVQPHSGSQANMGVYFSVLQPGDTILGMDLAQGGHLTHGSPANFSGKLYKIVSYGVNRETELVDYDQLRETALAHRPKMIVAGFSAYSRFLDFEKFRKIADEVGAMLMTDMAHVAGLVAAGLYPNPVPHSDFTTSTTHKTLRGPRGGLVLLGKDKENTLGITAAKSGRLKLMSEILDSTVFPGIQGGPLMHVIAGKAVAFKEALQPGFKTYASQILKNAKALSQGLTQGGVRIVSGGTDNHLMLLDVSALGVTGKDAETWLDEANITVNKNAIPYDLKSPMITSGIRVGTPAVTTRGMKESDMMTIAGFIVEALKSGGNMEVLHRIRDGVRNHCRKFPLFQGL